MIEKQRRTGVRLQSWEDQNLTAISTLYVGIFWNRNVTAQHCVMSYWLRLDQRSATPIILCLVLKHNDLKSNNLFARMKF